MKKPSVLPIIVSRQEVVHSPVFLEHRRLRFKFVIFPDQAESFYILCNHRIIIFLSPSSSKLKVYVGFSKATATVVLLFPQKSRIS